MTLDIIPRDTISLAEAERIESSKLTPRTLFPADIKQLPDPEWRIKGVLSDKSMVLVFGPYGCGKSFFVSDIALHIAMGWDWNGHKVKQGGTLYVCIEGGTMIKRRQAAIEKHYGIDLTDEPFGVVLEPTNIFNSGDVDQLIADAKAVPSLCLIILDTANRVMPGTKEDTEDFGKLIDVCGRLQAETGATVLIVHHTGKDDNRGSRGGYNLPAGMDTVVPVTKDKKSGIATAVIDKQRDGPEGPLLSFGLNVIELALDEDGDPITSCAVEPVDGATVKQTTRLTSRQRRAMDSLHNILINYGQPAPDAKHYPTGATVVPVDTWREHLSQSGVIDKGGTNPRQEFKRLRDGLSDKGAIREWNDLMWAVQSPVDGKNT